MQGHVGMICPYSLVLKPGSQFEFRVWSFPLLASDASKSNPSQKSHDFGGHHSEASTGGVQLEMS